MLRCVYLNYITKICLDNLKFWNFFQELLPSVFNFLFVHLNNWKLLAHSYRDIEKSRWKRRWKQFWHLPFASWLLHWWSYQTIVYFWMIIEWNTYFWSKRRLLLWVLQFSLAWIKKIFGFVEYFFSFFNFVFRLVPQRLRKVEIEIMHLSHE